MQKVKAAFEKWFTKTNPQDVKELKSFAHGWYKGARLNTLWSGFKAGYVTHDEESDICMGFFIISYGSLFMWLLYLHC